VLNSPCNPTGAAYDRAEMSAIVDAIADSGAVVISDEIYEDIVYTEAGHVSPLHVQPDLFERCCVVTGLSKGFAMTGWRAGIAIAPTWWLNGMSRLQGHVTSNINAVTQQAAIEAFAHRELIRPLVEVFRKRRDLVLPWLNKIPEVTALPPEGTFYLYMDVSSYLGRTAETADTDSISKWLLEEHLIALVPGTAFGDPGRLRLSFAASESVLEEAFDRMASAFSSI